MKHKPLDVSALPMLDQMKNACFVLNGTGFIIHANPAAAKLVVQKPEQLKGTFFGKFVTGAFVEGGPLEPERLAPLLENEEALEVVGMKGLAKQLNQVAPDGSPCYMWTSKQPPEGRA